MASTYGYTTVANLEKHAVIDYETTDAALTDAVVESKISDAEKYVNIYVGGGDFAGFTGTIPDDIELITKMIAKIYMDNHMIEQKIGPYADAGGVIIEILERYDIIDLLEKRKDQYNAKRGTWISKRVHAPRNHVRNINPLKWY